MVIGLAPFARTPCQMRPSPRSVIASTITLKLTVTTSPISPFPTRSRACIIAGSLCACKPTKVCTLAALALFAISVASARLAPKGHSQQTGLFASIAALTSCLCHGTRTTTAIRSISGCSTISFIFQKASPAPNFSAEALAVSSWEVQTAFNS